MSIRVIRCEGDGFTRGKQVGVGSADLIQRSLAFYRGYLGRRGLPAEDLPGVLGPYRDAAAAAYPDLLREIDGMAEGAGCSWWELFAVNAFEEIEPLLAEPAGPERCSAFVAESRLAHNEMWLAGDAGNVVVVEARPEDGPAFASATVACCLPVVGMNAAGLAFAVMSVTARDDGVGIPRVLVSRDVLEATDREDVVRRATPAHRSGGYAYEVAVRGSAGFLVETTATRHAVLDGRPAHANHYLAPELAEIAEPPSAGSVARQERTERLLASRPPRDERDAMAILSDHDSEPPAICLHADPSEGDDASAVVFSVVCDVESMRMWVAPGYPCTEAFEEIDLAEALG
jgi:isopenicillin-N N-acyltransferase-like protein